MKDNAILELDKLEFDYQNPRLSVDLQAKEDESAVIRYMIRDGNLSELMQSIAEMGFSKAEPLLVTPSTAHKGLFTVVEGNRRLAALKVLQNPELAEIRQHAISEITDSANCKPTEIPVLIYDKRDDILDYLGYRHITGIKEWGALEKAKYLDQLYRRHIASSDIDTIYRILAKMIGSRADYTRTYHTAYHLMVFANGKDYFNADIVERDINFSFITTALSYKSIRNYLCKEADNDILNPDLSNLNADHYKSVFIWLFDPDKKAIDDSRQIKDIGTILKYPEATAKLLAGASLLEALQYTSAPNEIFLSFVEKAKQNLLHANDSTATLTEEPVDAYDILDRINVLLLKMSSEWLVL